MGKVLLYVASLVQITVAAGSQIRMELKASDNDEMASFYWRQSVHSTVENSADIIEADSTDASGIWKLGPRVKLLGKNKNYKPTLQFSDVDDIAKSGAMIKASLTMHKSTKKGEFLASLDVVKHYITTFELIGDIDSMFYGLKLPGTIFMSKGRWPHLIDI